MAWYALLVRHLAVVLVLCVLRRWDDAERMAWTLRGHVNRRAQEL